ncbi:hypothetical protein [Bdellovibrio svalbardensis]|uniref:Uncharacterized protein n=1 Tax=Bdellovibrio svalbardensis TaxID=2972972 RepID=A0ABT6DH64_9BACT|nr:hypothetical protein [Bdellovibrio svalbardensis]MDG0816180.1 hypothetical protein [Bdellovibrio svalbardensis]
MAFKRSPVGTTILAVFGGVLTLLLPLFASAQVRTEMKLFSDSFISPEFEATQKTNYQFVGAQLKTESFSEDALRMDIAGGVAMGSPLMNYLNIGEFYYQSHQNASETFYIGRKKLLWNELDSRWNLGVWQPVFKWNPLAPEEQGLSGIFWQIDKPLYTFVLFGSPLYIPSQGPSFEIEEGDFAKGNPWFHQPPQSVRIWNEATKMQYRFDQPNTSEIVLQNSYGAKIAFGDPQGFRTQLSYLYGPDNVLAIGYQGSLDISTLKGNVELQPQVFFHSLTGADMTYKINRWKVGVSGLWDRPGKEKIFDEQWSQPLFEDALLVSPFVEWDNGLWAVNLMRLDIFGGEIKEVGENLANTPLTNLYPFQQANQISLMTNLGMGKGQRLIGKLSYTHSDKNDFQLIRINTRYRLSGLWSFFGEAQVLKAGPTSKSNVNDIAQFANNDRMMLGVSYAL